MSRRPDLQTQAMLGIGCLIFALYLVALGNTTTAFVCTGGGLVALIVAAARSIQRR